MASIKRRDFLRLAGGSIAGTLLPLSIRRALAAPAAVNTGTIQDVQHVVIFMQENRSFDHYYGTLKGVRGYGDRITIPVGGGTFGKRSVWQQAAEVATYSPFRLNTQITEAECMEGFPHDWATTHAAWNNGRCDSWVPAKRDIAQLGLADPTTGLTMGYFTREDLAFQYALADAFTVCDQYHCSLMGPTTPNRLFQWTGMNDPTGQFGGPAIDNDGSNYLWTTYPERLQAAGISWRTYQDPNDNYGDDPTTSFKQYSNLPPDSPLLLNGRSLWTLDQLKQHVQDGTLPQVSWIVAPQAYSEHPSASPIWGAQYTTRILEALTANPDVWNKTVLFINYDENDGFFDHIPPPTPPSQRSDGSYAGLSTVNYSNEIHPVDNLPYGLGMRVPMTIISPWTKGGWVCSEVFDHTSVLRFLEQRFGVMEPNITAWRRAVTGDLTSAFDFANPNNSVLPTLPDTSHYTDYPYPSCQYPGALQLPPIIPEMLTQESGVKPSRAIPYELHASGEEDSSTGKFWIAFSNTGQVGAVFHVYDNNNLTAVPQRYTVEPGKQLSDSWALGNGAYDLMVFGPNGWLRHFQGAVSQAQTTPEVQVCYDLANSAVVLKMRNPGSTAVDVTVKDNAYQSGGPWTATIAAGSTWEQSWPLTLSGRWYDFVVGVTTLPNYFRRFAGRMENGQPSTSDPVSSINS